jgi:methionine-rich copper-binding protein CopC
MTRRSRSVRGLAALLLALGLTIATVGSALAHARYDYSVPAAGSAVDGQPFVLKAYFTQELTSKSTLRVIDANGVQVDYADGHVDLDDPDRKVMLVTLPELPVGVYTVEYVAESAEDGHAEPGTFAFGVGMAPPSAEEPPYQPDAVPGALPIEGAENAALDAY